MRGRTHEWEEGRTCAAPKAIVAICERSPHSPRKVRTKACTNTGPRIREHSVRSFSASPGGDFVFRDGEVALPASMASSGIAPMMTVLSDSISSSASLISSSTFPFPLPMARPSPHIFTPNTRKSTPAMNCVHVLGTRVGRTCPRVAERADIRAREPKAPRKTMCRG
jgi:hypothetical protein